VNGNFGVVTRVLLSKITPDTTGKRTYVYGDQVFHYTVVDGITYLCLTDEDGESTSYRIPFLFLENVQEQFCGRYDMETRDNAIAFSLNADFSPTLGGIMDHFNSDKVCDVDAISRVQNEIESVKETMVQNIESILERGEKIELLVESTDNMNQQAFTYERSARRLERTMYWRKIRRRGFMVLGFSLLLASFAIAGCGGIDFQKCRQN